MKYIETNLPVIESTVGMVENMTTRDATKVLKTHLGLGFRVTGGVLHLAAPHYALTAVLDVEADTFEVTATEDNPSRIR